MKRSSMTSRLADRSAAAYSDAIDRHYLWSILMNAMSSPYQRYLLLALLAVMAATRSHHVATMTHLPDASWAIFFLGGFYIKRWDSFGILAVLAALVDYIAIQRFGVSDYCVSLAYPMLIPAYGALWMAGRWYGQHHRMHWATLPFLVTAVVSGAVACEVLSGGSFYALSGRFAEATLAGYGAQFLRYFPASLGGMAFYILPVALVHAVAAAIAHHGQQASAR